MVTTANSKHSIGQANSEYLDNLQPAYNDPQAPQAGSQYPSGGNLVNVAPASSSAAQPHECSATGAGTLTWPPGVAGSIAQIIYSSAHRPVQEVAIVSALGLLAGVCGRAWLTPSGSGLNVYIVLLARSGIGKETMSDGISMFMKGASQWAHNVDEFYKFADFASGQALVNAVSSNPCFTQIAGEFGRKLKRMSNHKDTALQELRTTMTKLYAKSGPSSIVGGISYSDTKNDKKVVSGVAYSMIGDSTPVTFREALTEDMMEDGFMSRLTVIEYDGERPHANNQRLTDIPEEWGKWLTELIAQARALLHKNLFTTVEADGVALDLLDDFDIECDNAINATEDEAQRQMWNRAHLKALRIASLLAVADNYLHPCITTEQAHWAINLIRRDIAVFSSKLESGDIGDGDGARETKVLSLMRDYLIKAPSAGYKVPEPLRKKGIIQRGYLLKRTAPLPLFKNHAQGATRALDQTLKSLERSGYIMKCNSETLFQDYNERGECYRVMNIS